MMRMINKDKEGLEELLCYNDTMMEQDEDLQHQEEAWREDKRIKKAQEESEEHKKQAEMDACVNKEQQVPEEQQAENSQWNTQRNKNISIRHRNILKFCLIPCPRHPQMTIRKHRWMTHLVS